MTPVYVGKKLVEVQLIHADQMSLYSFIILRRKKTPAQLFSCGICEMLENSGGCF